jgi:hypothetical protein
MAKKSTSRRTADDNTKTVDDTQTASAQTVARSENPSEEATGGSIGNTADTAVAVDAKTPATKTAVERKKSGDEVERTAAKASADSEKVAEEGKGAPVKTAVASQKPDEENKGLDNNTTSKAKAVDETAPQVAEAAIEAVKNPDGSVGATSADPAETGGSSRETSSPAEKAAVNGKVAAGKASVTGDNTAAVNEDVVGKRKAPATKAAGARKNTTADPKGASGKPGPVPERPAQKSKVAADKAKAGNRAATDISKTTATKIAADTKTTVADADIANNARSHAGHDAGVTSGVKTTAVARKLSKESVEKFSQRLQRANDFNVRNLEALVKSSKVAARSLNSIGREIVAYSRKVQQDRFDAAREISSAGTVAELIGMQTLFARKAVESWTQQAVRMSEIYTSAALEIARPIEERVVMATEETKSIMR